MNGQRITLAAAAEVPLYLPLYVAEKQEFFGFISGYDINVVHAEKHEDGDKWALDKLVDPFGDNRLVQFAVCDPLKTCLIERTVVIATIVCKAAFWVVDRDHLINSEEDFAPFDKLWTYPEGMSAYSIAKIVEQRSK